MPPRLGATAKAVLVVALAALAAGAVAYAYASSQQWWRPGWAPWGPHPGWGWAWHGPGPWWARGGWAPAAPAWHAWRGAPVTYTLSQDYVNQVMQVLESNNATATLLNQGYSVAAVKPLLHAAVGAGGRVEITAEKAIVVLARQPGPAPGMPARIVVLVDISSGTVTPVKPPYLPLQG